MDDQQLNHKDTARGTMLRDGPAFAEVARRNYGAIYLTALSIVRDYDTAQDVTQETFLRAWLKIDTLRDANLIQPWLGRIVRNLATQWLRTGQQRSRVLPLISMEELTVEPADNINPNPRQAAGQAEQQGQLADAVMALPEDLRQVVLLHYAEGMTPSDIARLNGEAPSTVTRRLDKARAQLRQHLESGLAVSLAMLKPRPRQLEKTLGLLTAAVALPAAARAQLLSLVADTPPPPLIDPVTLAAHAAPSEGAGIMKSLIENIGVGKLLAGAAALAAVGAGTYAVTSLADGGKYAAIAVGETRTKTIGSVETPIDHRMVSVTSRSNKPGYEKESLKRTGSATTGTADNVGRKITPAERIALLENDSVSTQPELVLKDGETTGLTYFNIEVVDESGLPVKGAKVTIDQILKLKRGSSGFETTPKDIISDSRGIARVHVPRYFDDLLETDGIVVQVEHPDYAFFNNIINFKSFKKVVLKRGDILKIFAYDEASSVPLLSGVEPTQGADFNRKLDWDRGNDGSINVRKINVGDRFSRGKLSFYLTATKDNGELLISEYQNITFPRSNDEPLHITLRQGLSVSGAVSRNVKRPIKNGKVVAIGESGGGTCGSYQRREAPIREDGTFNLTKLPAGKVFIWALADGWSSVNNEPDNPQGQPQEFGLQQDNQSYTLPMEETATAEITVVDSQGSPVPGVVVGANPNMCYEGCCSLWIKSGFAAITDVAGIAIIYDLPPLPNSHFRLHGDWELLPAKIGTGFLAKSIEIDLVPGQTVKKTVVAYPVGSMAITQDGDEFTTAPGKR